MIYTVRLLDTRDGKEYTHEDEYTNFECDAWDLDGGVVWDWTDGNYSCDCNRSGFVDNALPDLDCNTGDNLIKLLSIVREDGRLIWHHTLESV